MEWSTRRFARDETVAIGQEGGPLCARITSIVYRIQMGIIMMRKKYRFILLYRNRIELICFLVFFFFHVDSTVGGTRWSRPPSLVTYRYRRYPTTRYWTARVKSIARTDHKRRVNVRERARSRPKIKLSLIVKKGPCRTIIFAGVSFFTLNIDNITERPRKPSIKKGSITRVDVVYYNRTCKTRILKASVKINRNCFHACRSRGIVVNIILFSPAMGEIIYRMRTLQTADEINY